MFSTRAAISVSATLLAGLLCAPPAQAADPASCRLVRMSDPGWADITSTNAMLGLVLEGLGYKQKVDTLSVPVTFESLKNGQLDAFLGNWMPAQERFVKPLTDAGALVVIRRNLDGIRFTLAVPDYVASAGIKDLADLAANADKFDKKIYGIESGAPGNQNIQKMIEANDFGLKDWTLVESSEQGMLSQVEKAKRAGKWTVFLAWEPHPMNAKYAPAYLSGGDKYFGANYGAASVYTVTRRGFSQDCPNLAKLLGQLTFDVGIENAIMGAMADGMAAEKAARAELKKRPELMKQWLLDVETADGKPGLEAVQSKL
jgi:glycine betaine/proline transport system substrate-binding protein